MIAVVHATDHLETVNQTGNSLYGMESDENSTETTATVSVRPFVYFGRHHPRRLRRSNSLDSLGPIMRTMMNMDLKDIFQPEVANAIENIVRNQIPTLLRLFMAQVQDNFSIPTRLSMANITVTINAMSNRSAPNATGTPSLTQLLRRPRNQ